MLCPANKKITIGKATYRGGDELPAKLTKEQIEILGLKQPAAKPKAKEGKDG